ncbi:MAG: M1 family metallopeptidase [Vicinamibacterales bacterium]
MRVMRVVLRQAIVLLIVAATTPVACTGASDGSPAAVPPPASLTGAIAPPLSPRNANYAIDATLDAAARKIAATATIEWRNTTANPAGELQFHLYWNAWKDEGSTFMRERARVGEGGLPDEGRGRIDITSLSLSGPDIDLMDARRFVLTDAGTDTDETVMAVRLPVPVQPGESVTIGVAWTADIPAPIARTGAVGDYFFIAHWYPKLGVFEDTGWNTHQFHASTEFFADYGVYDVRLTVPRGWVVGATGVERERVDAGEQGITHRYYQEDVHDFAWTTSPEFLERSAVFEPAEGSGAGGAPVHLRLLLQPEHLGQESRHFDAARAALQLFGEWFGPYPFGHLTIVDPAYRSRSAGMEYPTLFTAGTSWIVPDEVTFNTPEEVTVHEAGHQWWQGVVGSNEFENAWIDEGITTFATARVMDEGLPQIYLEGRFFGDAVAWVYRDIPLSRETFLNRRAGYRRNGESDVPATPSYRYHPGGGFSITYNKTALWLHTLERWLGWEVVQRGLQTLFEENRFSHPTPDDVFRALSTAAGRDLTPFFDEVFRSSNTFDYGVEQIESSGRGDSVRSTVIVRRYGEAIFPVDIAMVFADGTRVMESWDGRDRWRAFEYERGARLVSAEVDPERVLLLDVDFTNNSRTTKPMGEEVATKWSLKWLVWLQDAMSNWTVLL